MRPQPPAHPLLDTLIKENNLKNDAALCRELDLFPAEVSKIRHNRLIVTDTVRVKIMRRFHWTINRLDQVVPPVVQ